MATLRVIGATWRKNNPGGIPKGPAGPMPRLIPRRAFRDPEPPLGVPKATKEGHGERLLGRDQPGMGARRLEPPFDLRAVGAYL